MDSLDRHDESETDDGCSDDSQEDPTFDVLEETFSNLSLKRKTKARSSVVKPMNGGEDEELDSVEIVLPQLNDKEQRSYEAVLKIIEVGQVERLKVDECKIYLRKHGLRLSGNKETLIQRIKEHIEVSNGGGEKKYPASSFVLNCKGDACMGDTVMFEQNVYEMFNIASRSANGPPCGTRIVAGRIVKESYGAAKQQHTFTIEVLWSKGERPLPPLHPMLIKGRNLYRLKTLRQKWEDEGERQKILSEKHARGGVARLNREARIQHKEMRKMHKPTRPKRDEHLNRKQEDERREHLHYVSMEPEILINHPKQRQQQHQVISKINIPNSMPNAQVLPEYHHQRQPLININSSSRGVQQTNLSRSSTFKSSTNPSQVSFQEVQHFGENQNYPLHGFHDKNNTQGGQPDTNLDHSRYSQHSYGYHRKNVYAAGNPPFQEQGFREKQICRYYAQGRCHFGDRCRNLHEIGGNRCSRK